MGAGLVRMDPDARPNVRVALGDGDDVTPFLLARGDVEEAGDAALARVFEYFVLTFGQSLIIEMTMTIDQPHPVASCASSSSSSSLGNTSIGCEIGVAPSPAALPAKRFSAASGMRGPIAH